MKQLNRRFVHFLRSCGFRGPAEDQGFDLSPTLVPVAVLADEQDTLTRYWTGYVGVLSGGGNPIILELACPVPIRVRGIWASVEAANPAVGFATSRGSLIAAAPVARAIGSSDVSPSLCTARSGQMTATPAFLPMVKGSGFGGAANVLETQFIVPSDSVVVVGATAAIAIAQGALGMMWEELEGH